MKKNILAILLVSLFVQLVHASEKKHEVSLEVILDNGDAIRASTFGALEYTFHINDSVWVGLSGFSGPIVVDGGSGLTVTNGDWIWGGAPLVYFNIPTLLGATKEHPEKGSQCQLYTSLGMGYLHVENEGEVYGVFGGGLLWESGTPWLGLRFDVKGLFYMLDNSRGSAFNSDLALSIGPSFMF